MVASKRVYLRSIKATDKGQGASVTAVYEYFRIAGHRVGRHSISDRLALMAHRGEIYCYKRGGKRYYSLERVAIDVANLGRDSTDIATAWLYRTPEAGACQF